MLDFDVIDTIVIDFDLHDNWFLILMVIATDPAHFWARYSFHTPLWFSLKYSFLSFCIESSIPVGFFKWNIFWTVTIYSKMYMSKKVQEGEQSSTKVSDDVGKDSREVELNIWINWS